MSNIRHKIIVFYHSLKRKNRPKPFYLYFGGKRPFKIGEILRSNNNNGFKTISYGTAKIIGVYKETKFIKFANTHPKWKAFFIKLGFKFRVYDYKCIAVYD